MGRGYYIHLTPSCPPVLAGPVMSSKGEPWYVFKVPPSDRHGAAAPVNVTLFVLEVSKNFEASRILLIAECLPLLQF